MTAPAAGRAGGPADGPQDGAADLGLVHLLQRGEPDAPVLLLLHGTGGDERDLLPLGRLLDPRATLLSPRGAVLEDGMPRFFRRLAEGVFDEDDVVRRSGDLAAFVAGAVEAYGLHGTPVVAVGFSNGANTAAATMLLHPDVLAAGVLLAAMPVLDARLPDPLPDLGGAPVLIGTGRVDPLAPPPVAQRLADTLTAAGARVRVEVHPGGHGLDRRQVTVATAWLREALAEPPPA